MFETQFLNMILDAKSKIFHVSNCCIAQRQKFLDTLKGLAWKECQMRGTRNIIENHKI